MKKQSKNKKILPKNKLVKTNRIIKTLRSINFLRIFLFFILASLVSVLIFFNFVCNDVKLWIDAKIRLEQIDLHQQSRMKLIQLKNQMTEWEELIWEIEKKRYLILSEDERGLLNQLLLKSKDASFETRAEADNYFNDKSIQYYPRAVSSYSTWFYELYPLSIRLENLAQTAKLVVFSSRLTQEQVILLSKDFYIAKGHLDWIFQLEKE